MVYVVDCKCSHGFGLVRVYCFHLFIYLLFALCVLPGVVGVQRSCILFTLFCFCLICLGTLYRVSIDSATLGSHGRHFNLFLM